MKTKFYLEDSKWYIDLPEWKGSKEDLEMVLGVDILLTHLSRDSSEVYVEFTNEEFEGCHTLTHIGDGYYYNSAEFGPDIIWLCYVTEFIFGEYPNKIYYNESNL